MSGVEFLRPGQQPRLDPPAAELPDGPGPLPDAPAERPVPGRVRRLRRRLGPRSLTARLTVGVVAFVIVIVIAIATATYFALRPFLFERLDQQLGPIASGNASRLDQCIRIDTTNCPISGGPSQYSAPQTEWIVAINTKGAEVIYPRSDTTAVKWLHLTTAQRKALYANPDAFRTYRTTDGIELRLTGRALDSPNQNIVVITGLATTNIRTTLGHLVLIELVIGASAVVLALLATSYGVSFGLRRLRRVTTTAQEVALELSPTGAGLDRRVDVPDDGTEVGQLAESMNTLLSAVETQFKARLEGEARLRQFLADASHELRTPLTSIRGYAELARMQKAAGANAEDNLARIESEGTRMSRLVEDLLMLARGEQPAEADPVRELVDVADLVDDAANGTRAAFPSREIVAEAGPGLMVIGDQDQLLRALRNLLANAAVHTAPERPIRVRGLTDGDGVLIQVVDGGPGLPPEEAAHVFERFWRADKARTRARGGTGLGLSIVAAIIASHDGTVRFDSSVEGGSTVTIRLPAVHY